MTNRTLLWQTQEDYEEDSVPTDSSQSEEFDSDEEFLVERILAEKHGEGGKSLFLISWADYPEETSTWEPIENIQDLDILKVWKERKKKEAEGLEPAFDLTRFNARIQQLQQEKQTRHRSRKAKRKRRGIPVSPGPENGHSGEDTFDVTEAVESDDLKENSVAPEPRMKPPMSNERSNQSVQEAYVGGESENSNTSEDSLMEKLLEKEKKKAKNTTRRGLRYKGAASQSEKTDQYEASSKKSLEKPKSRRPSSSFSEVPMSFQTLPEVISRRFVGRERQPQEAAEALDNASSRHFATSLTESTKQTMTTASQGRPGLSIRRRSTASIASAVSRGRGATRGGSFFGPKNVFASRGPLKTRPTLIETSADTSKAPKHYSNMRIRRKAELASRALAERAPDVAALGGLFTPSNPSGFVELRPASQRNREEGQNQQSAEDYSMDIDDRNDLFVNENTPTGSPDRWTSMPEEGPADGRPVQNQQQLRPEYQKGQHGHNAICHFWRMKGSCANGYQCDFKHVDQTHIPFGPPPPDHVCNCRHPKVDHSYDLMQSGRPQYQAHHGSKAICHFWQTKGSCTKGIDCTYVHTDDHRLPIAPAPQTYGKGEIHRPFDESPSDKADPPVLFPPLQNNSPAPKSILAADRPLYTPEIRAICPFWYYSSTCKKGDDCIDLHDNDARLAIAPGPSWFKKKTCKFWVQGHCSKTAYQCVYLHEQYDALSEQKEDMQPPEPLSPSSIIRGNTSIHSGPQTSVSYAKSDENPSQPDKQDATSVSALPRARPLFDSQKPAICPFWHFGDYCTKGARCKFIHADNSHLAIAPIPSHKHETCKFWAAGYCSKTSQECVYLHGYQGDPEDIIGTPDRTMTVPNGRRKKVAAPGDGPVVLTDEPETCSGLQPMQSRNLESDSPIRDHKYEKVCPHWERKDCWHGEACLYWHSYDGSDRISAVPPDGRPRHPKFNKVCGYWPQGTCRDGDQCPYWHSPDGSDKVKQTEAIPPIPSHEGEVPVSVITEAAERGAYTSETTSLLNRARDTKDLNQGHPARPEVARKAVSFRAAVEYLESETTVTSSIEPDQTHRSNQAEVNSASSPSIDQGRPEIVFSKPKRPTSKITMEYYRRNRAIKNLGERAKEITFGNDENESIFADFGDLTCVKQFPWGQTLAALTQVHFTKLCLAQDWKAQSGSLHYQILWQGSLCSISADEANTTIDKASRHLRLTSAGFVAICRHFMILIYPSIEEWKFLEGSVSFSKEAGLRYLVFRSSLDFSSPPDTGVVANSTNYRQRLVESIHGLKFQSLVPKVHPKQKIPRYHFYLLFPSTANATAEFIANWLRQAAKQCNIYSSQTEGGWDSFVKDPKLGTGIVLVHESVVACVCELPSLRHLLAPEIQSRNDTFWYIAEGVTKNPMYGSPRGSTQGQITATRLLPHGHAFLLTPSFLVAEPERAYGLLKWFVGKHAKASPGTWKLVCAYNIREYLLDLAMEKSAERDKVEGDYQGQACKDAVVEEMGLSYASCLLRFRMHDLVIRMLSQRERSDSADSYGADIDGEFLSPIIFADAFVDADDEEALVTWFAGWAMCKLDHFRKFTVVGTGPKSRKRAMRRKVVTSAVTSPESGEIVRSELSRPSERGIRCLLGDIEQSTLETLKEPPRLRADEVFMDHSANSYIRPSEVTSTRLTASDPGPPSRGALPGVDSERVQILRTKSNPSASTDARPSSTTFKALENKTFQLKTKGIARKDFNEGMVENDEAISDHGNEALKKGITHPIPLKRGSVHSPSQFDGGKDERPTSTASTRSFRSRIRRDDDGRYSPPGSVRENTTIKPELADRPGFLTEEDKDTHRPPKRQALGDSSIGVSHDPSQQGWKVSRAHDFPQWHPDMMEIDSPVNGEKMEKGELITKLITYEATTTWYERWYKEGHGWEHVFVESWEKAWKYLGVKEGVPS